MWKTVYFIGGQSSRAIIKSGYANNGQTSGNCVQSSEHDSLLYDAGHQHDVYVAIKETISIVNTF